MNLKLILFAVSIIQFSVCHSISNGSSHCQYKNYDDVSPYIAVDCEGAVFHSNICDKLKDDVNVPSISTVSFQNCEISEYSHILDQFPNITKLAFLKNNTLPSVGFSNFEHFTVFKSVDSKINTTTTSATPLLSLNAADLEWFQFHGNLANDVSSILLENATKMENFILKNTMVSSLPADFFKNSTNLKIIIAPENEFENIDTIDFPNSVQYMDFSSNKIGQLTKDSFKNLTNMQILEFAGNKISKIEEETFSQMNNNLAYLDLSNNLIKEINKTTLKGLNNLIIAYFSENDIHYLEDGAFESTPKLLSLILYRNNISSLNQRMFAGLNRLTLLQLARTLIRELTTESFGNLPQLRVLEMCYGIIETVDFNAFANLPKLGHLNLEGNQISRLVKMAPTNWNTTETTNNTFRNDIFENINGVDLEWITKIYEENKETNTPDVPKVFKLMVDLFLKYFPEIGTGSNYGLKKLILSGNQLIEVQNNIFVEFKSLKELFLSRNPILALYPESFASLNELESLKLDYCKLTSVDFSMFRHLTKLQRLDLSNNQLTSIAPAQLLSIANFYLNDNLLTDFPMKRSDLINLTELHLENNDLVNFPFSKPEHQMNVANTSQSVEVMKNLNYLRLSNNSITQLFPHFFNGLNELKDLFLDDLELKSVDFSVFTQLTKLEELDLSYNKLETITAAPLPSINILWLNDNQLVNFPMKKSDFPNLKTFGIANNPLKCSNMDHSFDDIELKCDSQN